MSAANVNYIISGEDYYLVNSKLKMILKSIGIKQSDAETYYYPDTECNEVIEALRTFSFFGSDKIIIYFVEHDKKDEKNKFDKTDIKKISEYLKSPNEKSSLIIINNSSRKLFTKTKNLKHITIKKLYDNSPEIHTFISDKLSSKNVDYTSQIPGLIKEMFGTDLNLIDGEIEKLIMFLDEGQSLDEPTFFKLCDDLKVNNIFDLTESVLSKDFERAVSIYKKMLLQGTTLYGLTTILLNNFNSLLVYILRSKRSSDKEIMSDLSIKNYYIFNKIREKKRYFNYKEIINILKSLYDLELQFRVNQPLKAETFTVFLYKLCKGML